MTLAEAFNNFIQNIKIKNSELISSRYAEITSTLNKCFRDTDSNTANSLQVGSIGRNTAINGISDLDMLYIMPETAWNKYNSENGPYNILKDTKDAILSRYPKTGVNVDRLVVTVQYIDFHIEVQPVFEQEDKSFKYPDTYQKIWKTTKPREEIFAISDFDNDKNGNVRNLCKMMRAWKDNVGVNIGGLLIDTLVYNFFEQTNEYNDKSFNYYHYTCRDFFKFLSDEPEQDYYLALGSNQQVKVKEKFQSKAKKAYNLCLEAIEKDDYEKWRDIFGRKFPNINISKKTSSFDEKKFDNTEEFIEDKYPVTIKYSLQIDCYVHQNGYRECRLSYMLNNRIPLLAKKKLIFFIDKTDVPKPYEVKWKVLNRGVEAERRNDIRGQIIDGDEDNNTIRTENTKFKGNHFVECYIIKDNIVVARDRILVPIATNE